MKTSELTGAALDWAAATCEGVVNGDGLDIGFILEHGYTPSTDWAQGGPIIEREGIWIAPTTTGQAWDATRSIEGVIYRAPTPLIAAMRCYVTSRLGEEVDIPDELKEK